MANMNKEYLSHFKKMAGTKSAVSPTPSQRSEKPRPLRPSNLAVSLGRRKKVSTKAPVFAIAAASVGLILASWGFVELEKVEKFLDRIEIGFLGKIQAESKEEKASPTDTKSAPTLENNSPAQVEDPGRIPPKISKWTDEELSFFSKLEARKKELDARTAEIARMEEELHKQKIELDDKIVKLEKMRKEIATTLEQRIDMDKKKIDTLVEFYSNMKPPNAAKLIEELNEDLAVEIIGRLKKKNAADILNLIKLEKAQRLSEKFAGYRSQ